MSTPVAVGIVGGIMGLTLPILAFGSALDVRQQVLAAADAAALAAADALVGSIEMSESEPQLTYVPCAIAETVALAHGAVLAECSVAYEFAGGDVRVVVSRNVLFGETRARARAGWHAHRD